MIEWIKRIGFAGAAVYILLSPALPQLFDIGSPWVRPWTMYSGVGEGLPKGVFTARYESGAEEYLTALQVRDLPRYPNTFHYEFDYWVHDEASFRAFAADFCESRSSLVSLSFEGRVGAPDGWASHQVGDLCTPAPMIADASVGEAP